MIFYHLISTKASGPKKKRLQKNRLCWRRNKTDGAGAGAGAMAGCTKHVEWLRCDVRQGERGRMYISLEMPRNAWNKTPNQEETS